MDFGLWFAPPNGHEQSLQWQVGVGAALNGPTNNPPRKQIGDNSQTEKPCVGADAGDVAQPLF